MTQMIDQNSPSTNVGCTCQHPTDAARWDEHRALLRCTSCGRKIEDREEEWFMVDGIAMSHPRSATPPPPPRSCTPRASH